MAKNIIQKIIYSYFYVCVLISENICPPQAEINMLTRFTVKKKRIYTKIIQLRYKNKVAYKDIVTNQKIYKHRKSNHLCIIYEEFTYNHLMKKK